MRPVEEVSKITLECVQVKLLPILKVSATKSHIRKPDRKNIIRLEVTVSQNLFELFGLLEVHVKFIIHDDLYVIIRYEFNTYHRSI